MKVIDLNINEWQEWLEKFKASDEYEVGRAPIAMRIENTPFTAGRFAGGMTYNGARYTYFEPKVPGEPPNPDGTPHVAWLMVRMDFLMWLTKFLKDGGGKRGKGGVK